MAVVLSSCFHINNLKNEDMLSSYELLHAYYVACLVKGSEEKKKKDCICRVKSCKTRRRRVHACLSCIFFGCFEGHIHLHSEKENHPIAMDTISGRVYCFICKDYKYDSDFIKIARDQKAIVGDQRSTAIGMSCKWEPSAEEIHLLKQHKIKHNSRRGVRGLYNYRKIGTCYLNVIIQCLIHTPLFRDYLLSLQHTCDRKSICFICQMNYVMQKCFLGAKNPFVPTRFLWLIFKRVPKYMKSKNTYQDAYELYSDLLENFHKDETKEYDGQDLFISQPSEPCECVIHTIFGFLFHKKLTCANDKCRYTADLERYTSFEIFLYAFGELSLSECLKRKFDERDNKSCPKCNVLATTCSIPEKLPYVLTICIHRDLRDNSSCIKYDEVLDMAPVVLSPERENEEEDGRLQYKYYLFAVVNLYSFNANTGHYTCYIRKNKEKWFFCDDKEIDPECNIEDILNLKPRILFYHRMYL